jgi:hypothetical protein
MDTGQIYELFATDGSKTFFCLGDSFGGTSLYRKRTCFLHVFVLNLKTQQFAMCGIDSFKDLLILAF